MPTRRGFPADPGGALRRLAALALLWGAPATAQGPGAVRGWVSEQGTGVPVVGALVVLEGAGRGAQTDEAGAFALGRVAAGTYTLRIRALGYREAVLPLRLAPDGTSREVRVTLEPDPLQVEGVRVTGEARRGLQGLVVDEVTRRPLPGALLRLEPRHAALSDSAGIFALRDLPPGGGLILVEQFGYESLYVPVPPDRSVVLEIPLRPVPLGVDGLSVEVMRGNVAEMERRIGNRRNALPLTSWSYGQEALVSARSGDMRTFLESETPVSFTRCPSRAASEGCVVGRGGATLAMKVCIDEMPAPGGLLQLGSYRPSELYLVDVYSRGALVLVYTRAFMDRLARGRRALTPIEYLGC
jgi:hypothetical protein